MKFVGHRFGFAAAAAFLALSGTGDDAVGIVHGVGSHGASMGTPWTSNPKGMVKDLETSGGESLWTEENNKK